MIQNDVFLFKNNLIYLKQTSLTIELFMKRVRVSCYTSIILCEWLLFNPNNLEETYSSLILEKKNENQIN
jgi:hypothetical protein